jgi:spore coat polysaccharide biosynthesis protein SpsF
MKKIVIIQARMGSTRLPGKVLLDIAGQPMLARVISRVQQARFPDEVIVATSTESTDDELAAFCSDRGWPCFRGSNLDVLDRFYQAASAFSADILVRVSADCPLIDPDILDRVADAVMSSSGTVDYAANMLPPRTFPRGVDVEAFTFETLKRCWIEATAESHREHVTPYAYRNPDLFRLFKVTNSLDESEYRWTVDAPEDLEIVRRICRQLQGSDFRCADVVEVCRRHPEWADINAHVQQRAA